jgi:pterin-4a-carbinolamine dehydratase
MSASSTSRILVLRGARCFVDGRRLRVCRHRREHCVHPLLVHPFPSSYTRAYQTTPHHFFNHSNYLCSRSIQTQPSPEGNETNNNNDVRQQQQHQLLLYEQPIRRPTSSDPTAKRPTQKCDPYGLAGKSLSYTECKALISTLEDGWRLSVDPRENSNDKAKEARNHTNHHNSSKSDDHETISTACPSPIFLQKYYHHPTFHEASKFISHIALLATNHNHFPYLSIERILVEDLNNIYPLGEDTECNLDDGLGINNNADDIRTKLSDSGIRKRQVPKVKGWIFRSTVRCSTYRPATTSNANSHSSQENDGCISFRENITDNSSLKGLTYHDFHLAMSVDVEVNREDVKRWLVYWSSDENRIDE